MDANKIKEIQETIRKHQEAVRSTQREVPVGAGRSSDDLSKVMSNDIIGKGGEPDLRK